MKSLLFSLFALKKNPGLVFVFVCLLVPGDQIEQGEYPDPLKIIPIDDRSRPVSINLACHWDFGDVDQYSAGSDVARLRSGFQLAALWQTLSIEADRVGTIRVRATRFGPDCDLELEAISIRPLEKVLLQACTIVR